MVTFSLKFYQFNSDLLTPNSHFFLLFPSEQLQIANYGIGGHYEPHFDHAREDEDKFTDLGMGNRIATVLYYVRWSVIFPLKRQFTDFTK